MDNRARIQSSPQPIDKVPSNEPPQRSGTVSHRPLLSVTLSSSKFQIPKKVLQLSEIGALLETTVPLKTRKLNFKTYQRSFYGSELVDWVLNLKYAEKRSAAKTICEELLSKKLILSTSGANFNDSALALYYFPSPSSPNSLKKDPSSNSTPNMDIEDLVGQLSKGVTIRDRTYHLKTYKQVFVGSQAVDWLCANVASIKSRVQAVSVGQEMMDYGYLVHAAGREIFQDADLFYRFTDLQKRGRSTLSFNSSVSSEDSAELKPQVQLDLQDLARRMKGSLQIANRTWKLKKYKSCFTASQAVDWMIQNIQQINTREQAVALGNELLKRGAIFHVSGRTAFEDGELFYRFFEDDVLSDFEEIMQKMRSNVPTRNRTFNLKKYKNAAVGRDVTDWLLNQTDFELNVLSRKDAVSFGQRLITSGFIIPLTGKKFEDSDQLYKFSQTQENLMETSIDLDDFISDWMKGVQICDRKYKMTTYKNCFVASEAVTWLTKNVPKVTSRGEAVTLGQVALNQGLILHVAGKSTFKDGEYYFRFNKEECPLKRYGKSLESLSQSLMENITIESRKFRFTTYNDCFVASEAVTWMTENLPTVTSRTEATRLGQLLLNEGHIQHVAGKNVFSDGFFFYFFPSTATVTLQLKCTIEDIEDILVKKLPITEIANHPQFVGKSGFLSNDCANLLITEIKEITTPVESYLLGQMLMDEGIIYRLDNQPKFEEGQWLATTSATPRASRPASKTNVEPAPLSNLRRTGEDKKKKGWHLSILLPRPNNNNNNQPALAASAMFFGKPFLDLLDADEARSTGIPTVIQECLALLSAPEAIATEGLFRISSAAEYVELCKMIDSGKPVQIKSTVDNDPHIGANLLKKWLRDLPEPILTFALYNELCSLMNDTPDVLTKRAREIFNKLPPENYKMTITLLRFLKSVSEQCTINKMHARNLGTVFAPLLIRSPDIDPTALALYSTALTEVTQFLIEQGNEFALVQEQNE